MKPNKILAAILLLFTLFLTSCALFIPDLRFDGGALLDDNRMEQIKQEIFGSQESSEVTQSELETVESPYYDTTETDNVPTLEANKVYWTKGGSVWHLFDDCGHLKSSKSIISGSIEDAKKAGKEKVCSSCQRKQ